MDKPGTPWSVPVAVEDIPDGGLHQEIEAPAEARAAVAALAGLRDLPRFSAVFDLTRQGASVHLVGTVYGTVGQTCVVTLEPIQNEVEERIDLLFAPGVAAKADEVEIKTADSGGEPAEALDDGKIDLGALAIEFLMLGIEPYPRKAGVEFAAPKVEEGGERPFAALAALKKRMGTGPT